MFSFFLHAVISIFAVMNPLGILPTFMALTSGYTKREQRIVAQRAIFNAFFILFVFLVLGNAILGLFGITIHAFRVAGGILLFSIASNLLRAQQSRVQSPNKDEQESRDDISVTPLAIPIIAGPGTITSVMALSAGPEFFRNAAAVLPAFVLVLFATYVVFHYSTWIHNRLSTAQLNVITRLMGFLLSIMAVQMIATGIGGLFPFLLHR